MQGYKYWISGDARVAVPAMCITCENVVETAVVTHGEAEFHIAALSQLLPGEWEPNVVRAATAVQEATGADPGKVRGGWFSLGIVLCEECGVRSEVTPTVWTVDGPETSMTQGDRATV